MFEPIGKPRKLPFPLYNQISNGNIIDDAGLPLNEFIWPEDPEERTILPLFVSQREFTAILSAMDVGADIAYPEQYIEVMWIMIRNLRYGVNICEMIANCIATSEEAQQALREFVTSDTTINNYFSSEVQRLTQGQITGSIMTGSCDESNIAGEILTLIDALDQLNIDALEIVEVGTNDEERLSSFISGFPGFGLFPADEALDTMQDWLEDFAENYAAAITPEWKLEVAEDLFCIAKEKPDCALTFQDLFDYFAERSVSGLNILSGAVDVAQFLITGDFDTDELVASGMMAASLGGILTGREYFGMTVQTIGAITRDAPPSSAWEDWDECTTPTDEDCWDFTAGANAFDPYFNGFVYYAEYSSGNGFKPGFNPGIINIGRDISAFGTVVKATVTFSENVPSGINNTVTVSNENFTGPTTQHDIETDVVVFEGLSLANGIRIDITFDGTLPSTFYMTSLCVEYAP